MTSWLYKNKLFVFIDLLAFAICNKTISFIFNNLLASFVKIFCSRVIAAASRASEPGWLRKSRFRPRKGRVAVLVPHPARSSTGNSCGTLQRELKLSDRGIGKLPDAFLVHPPRLQGQVPSVLLRKLSYITGCELCTENVRLRCVNPPRNTVWQDVTSSGSSSFRKTQAPCRTLKFASCSARHERLRLCQRAAAPAFRSTLLQSYETLGRVPPRLAHESA
jgi:hypothetical protein